jgi:hypothetical protein
MKAALVLLAVVMAAGCKDQSAAQADISKGNPEGQQMRKKYEAANTDAQAQRDKQDK